MSVAAALAQSLPLMRAPVELAGMALMAHLMGLAARRDGMALTANPFLQGMDDPADAEADVMAAWREGWLTGG